MSFILTADEPSDDVCKLPLDTGKGNEKITRYYFDQKEQKCQTFKYGGKKGNANNFVTKEECQEECGFEPPGKNHSKMVSVSPATH